MTTERGPHVAEVEQLCATEASRVLKRRFFRVLGLYALSLSGCLCKRREFSQSPHGWAQEVKSDLEWGWEVGRLSRSVYFFFRRVDDFLDGDLKIPGDPLEYTRSLSAQIKSGRFTTDPKIGKLAQYSLGVLERKARPGDDPRQRMIDVLAAMAFDHLRSRERLPLSKDQLESYYRCTFFPLTDLMLIGLESQLRASDIPALSYSQGRVYCAKDLRIDWERGVINIPREVLEEGELTPHSSLEEVRRSPVVNAWLDTDLSKSRQELLALGAQLGESPERPTRVVAKVLIRPLLRDIDRLTRSG